MPPGPFPVGALAAPEGLPAALFLRAAELLEVAPTLEALAEGAGRLQGFLARLSRRAARRAAGDHEEAGHPPEGP